MTRYTMHTLEVRAIEEKLVRAQRLPDSALCNLTMGEARNLLAMAHELLNLQADEGDKSTPLRNLP